MKSDEDVFEACCRELSQKHYVVIDHFLTLVEVTDILTGLKHKFSQGKFEQAGIGQKKDYHRDENIRGDWICWINPQETFAIMHRFIHCLEGFIKHVNRSCFLGLKEYELHYTMYPQGTGYQRHLDQFKKDDNRQLSFICYLNFDWKEQDGGALKLYLTDDSGGERCVDIYPCAGRFVCFRSHLLEHEVMATRRMRYSLTGWLLSRKRGLSFLK